METRQIRLKAVSAKCKITTKRNKFDVPYFMDIKVSVTYNTGAVVTFISWFSANRGNIGKVLEAAKGEINPSRLAKAFLKKINLHLKSNAICTYGELGLAMFSDANDFYTFYNDLETCISEEGFINMLSIEV